MRGSGRRRKQNATEDVRVEPLLSLGLLESLLPVHRGEFEQAMLGPARQEAEQIAQVDLRVESVHARASEQGNEDGVHDSGIVAAEEELVFPAEHFAPEVKLADIVAEGEPTVVEEASQCDALVARVADSCRKRGLIENAFSFEVAPFEELIDYGPRLRPAHLLFLVARRVRDGPLDAKQRTDVRERYLASLGVGCERLEEVATGMRPAANFYHFAVFIEVVVVTAHV